MSRLYGGRERKRLRDFAERRAEIARHYGDSQNMSETARAFGISRERVRVIVNKEQERAGDVFGQEKAE